MLTVDLGTINYLAVLVSAVSAFVLGGIWYAAIFAKLWIKLHGYSEADQKEMDAHPGRTFPLLFITDIVMAAGMAVVLNNLRVGEITWTTGVCLGLVLWIAIAAPIGLAQFVATWTARRNIGGWVIDTAYQLLALVLVGAILGAWR